MGRWDGETSRVPIFLRSLLSSPTEPAPENCWSNSPSAHSARQRSLTPRLHTANPLLFLMSSKDVKEQNKAELPSSKLQLKSSLRRAQLFSLLRGFLLSPQGCFMLVLTLFCLSAGCWVPMRWAQAMVLPAPGEVPLHRSETLLYHVRHSLTQNSILNNI